MEHDLQGKESPFLPLSMLHRGVQNMREQSRAVTSPCQCTTALTSPAQCLPRTHPFNMSFNGWMGTGLGISEAVVCLKIPSDRKMMCAWTCSTSSDEGMRLGVTLLHTDYTSLPCSPFALLSSSAFVRSPTSIRTMRLPAKCRVSSLLLKTKSPTSPFTTTILLLCAPK